MPVDEQEAHPQVTTVPTANAAPSTGALERASAAPHVADNSGSENAAAEQEATTTNEATNKPTEVTGGTVLMSPMKKIAADSITVAEIQSSVAAASAALSANKPANIQDHRNESAAQDVVAVACDSHGDATERSVTPSIPPHAAFAKRQVIATGAVPENTNAATTGESFAGDTGNVDSAAANSAVPLAADPNVAACPLPPALPQLECALVAAPDDVGTEAEARMRLYLTVAITYLASLSFGLSVGYSSPALPSIREAMEFSETDSDWFGALVMLGAAIGGLSGGRQVNTIGRRNTLIASSLWFMFGWLCLAVATPKAALFVGRLLTGVGTGTVALAVSVFISEISPANYRGLLSTGANCVLGCGVLLVFVLGKYLGFWLLAVCCLLPAAAMSVLLFSCPESPRWLLKHNRRDSAARALRFYFGPGAASELTILEAAVSRKGGAAAAAFSLRDMASPRVYRSFLCVLLTMTMQQLSAISLIITFTQDIFEQAGTTISPENSAIIVAFIQVVMVGVATFLADRLGRKILVLFSSAVSSVCLGALGLYFYYKSNGGDNFTETYGWLPLTSLCIYFVGYSVGLGPLPWVILGEMIPLKARAFATGTCTAIVFTEGFAVIISYNGMRAALGMAGTFWLFGAALAISFVLFLLFVPETGGKSLEDIEKLFGRSTPSQHESLVKNEAQNVN
ncbi:solute carrier family 2, facilitated glucose transporter member 8-like [Dermacentor albipictus]|uniref:solute carrier family 2, facilitated glucose transporter member 8-like n=1 Tax=Dermacentor albipictus TaxID=60249 RepID=UPI0031FC38CB